MAPTKVASQSEKKAGKSVKKLNVDLGMKYSCAKQYKRKVLWRLDGKKHPVVNVPKKSFAVVKKINGAMNGGERDVNLLKPKSHYPTEPHVPAHPARVVFRFQNAKIVEARTYCHLVAQGKRKQFFTIVPSILCNFRIRWTETTVFGVCFEFFISLDGANLLNLSKRTCNWQCNLVQNESPRIYGYFPRIWFLFS